MSQSRVSKRVTILTPLIIAALVSLSSWLGLLSFLDGRAYDRLLGLRADPVEEQEILLVDVDDKAIDYAGTWPIRRDVVADAVILMAEMGMSYLVFDIEYVDHSPTAVDETLLETDLPERSAALLTETRDNLISFLQAVQNGTVTPGEIEFYLPDVEEEFSATNQELVNLYGDLARNNDDYLGRSARIFDTAYFTVNLAPGVQLDVDPELIRFYQSEIALTDVRGDVATIPDAASIMPTIDPIIRRSAGAGFPNVIVDPDGVRRRVHLMQSHNGSIYGQLAFTPLLHRLGNPAIEVTRNEILLHGENDTIAIPRAEDGTMLINWPHADYLGSFRHLSFGMLLEHNFLLQRMLRNVQIRDDWGYLDEYRGEPGLARQSLDLSQMRRDAIFGGNRDLLFRYSEDLDRFLAEVAGYLSPEREARFMAALEEGRASGQIPESDAAFIANDYPVWVRAVRTQAEDIARIRAELREEVTGTFAVIGHAATGTTDIGVNPFSEQYVNIGTHAAVANTILTGDFLDDRPWYVAAAVSVVVSIVLALMIRSLGPVLSGLVDLGWGAAGIGASYLLMARAGVFVSPVNLVISNVLIYVVFTVIKFRAAEAEKGFIKDAFSHYLSEDVISEVLDDPSKLSLGGQKKVCTAMFTDVKGFSTISEQLSPEDLVLLLNRYLSQMSDIVLDERGTIDKYEGDAIIAFFGAPIDLSDHAARACRSAVAMKKVEIELNKEFLAEEMTPGPLLTRIGINSGDMVVGNMGTDRKMNYTMMGNTVNLAARLEGVNKQYGTWILISEATKELVGSHFLTRSLDRVRVVGINTPVRLFELVDNTSDATSEAKELVRTFEEGIAGYESRDFIQAHKLFSECLKIDKNDGPAQKFLANTEEFLENEPAEDWDAVVNLTSK